jgi:hypothetical protein
MSPMARIAHTHERALDVLTLLRELEENARVHLSGDTYDAGSDHSSRGRVASPTELSDVQRDASFAASRGADLPYVQVEATACYYIPINKS